MSLTKQRGPARILILIIAAVIIGWMVSGYLDNSFEVIMLETEKQYTVIDSEFKEIFENNDAEVISRQEQLTLLQKYGDLQYRVNIHLHVKNEKAHYRLSRENFNRMRFNTNLKFEVDRKVKDSITAIVEI